MEQNFSTAREPQECINKNPDALVQLLPLDSVAGWTMLDVQDGLC